MGNKRCGRQEGEGVALRGVRLQCRGNEALPDSICSDTVEDDADSPPLPPRLERGRGEGRGMCSGLSVCVCAVWEIVGYNQA